MVLVAATVEKVVGVFRAEIGGRAFYVPSKPGRITDFHAPPEFRRKALGNEIVERASTELKKMGAALITAEVPPQNEMAANLYTKRGVKTLMHTLVSKSQ